MMYSLPTSVTLEPYSPFLRMTRLGPPTPRPHLPTPSTPRTSHPHPADHQQCCLKRRREKTRGGSRRIFYINQCCPAGQRHVRAIKVDQGCTPQSVYITDALNGFYDKG